MAQIQQQQTQTKTANKPASKPASATKAAGKGSATATAQKAASAPQKAPQKAAPKLGFYGTLLRDCLAGKYGPVIQAYYVRAHKYHAKQKTQFPRAANATTELLKPQDAVAFVEKHKTCSIPSGGRTGQRLYDEMRVQFQPAATASK